MANNKFCKLFDVEGKGQILVKLDANSEGIPEVRFYAQPPDLGVCSVAAIYSDDDAGWDLAESYFAKVDAHQATKHTEVLFRMAEESQEAGQ